MICPRCGYANAPSDDTCARCGNALLPGGTLVQERRWVSVVFFDLSRFTEYALAHPLEDTWQAANNALQAAAGHARLFGGHIDKFFGDGFLAVFGVPRSQESDARAALEAARTMVASSPLPGRAGVASGLVLRTPLGGGLAGDQTVLGPAVNLSQRLSGAAPPGEVWTDIATIRLVHNAKSEALDPQPLKGYAEPLVPYRYGGLNQGPLHIYGREAELGELGQLVEKVQLDAQGQAASGQRVVVYGPIGVGKSHLVQHFAATLPAGVRGVMAPRLTNGVALRYALRQGLQDLLPEGLSQLRSLELPDDLRTILNFSIGIEEQPSLSREELDRMLVETWWHLLGRVAQVSPLVIVMDDLHNADPTVLEFTRRTPPPGVLLVLVSRQNRWAADADLHLISLKPLSLEHTSDLIRSFRPDLGPATALHLAETSGGYPLAVQALSLTSTGEPEPIPLYQPRLDTLPRLARVALQAAAVLGPTVPPELVRHLVGEEADLTRLVGEGFLEADEYGQLRFAIPYLREATLGQVMGQQAQQWHQQAALWYQRQGHLGESATHYEAAGNISTAYRMWRVVAQQQWSEQNYTAAHAAYLEALRLAEGGVRAQSALEAAEANLSLGSFQEALDLATLASQSPDIPAGLHSRAYAVRHEALLGLGRPEPLPEAEWGESPDPRLRLALARSAPPAQALELLQAMPANLEAPAKLVRASALLKLGQLARASEEVAAWQELAINSPVELFQARLLQTELLWRQHKPEDALQAVQQVATEGLPAWYRATRQAAHAALLLDTGSLSQVAALLEGALELLEGAPPSVVEQVGSVQLRYLIESGQLEEALQFGQEVVALAPNPQLLAMVALAYGLTPGEANHQALWRLVRGLEGVEDPEVQALCALALGLRALYEREKATDHLRKAVLLARKRPNPTLSFYALSVLGLAWEHQAPKKAQALSQYLLSQTAGRGFEVQHELARLLRTQVLLDQGRDPLTLLDFIPSIPLTQFWRESLIAHLSHQTPVSSPNLGNYGIVGHWIRGFAQRPQLPFDLERENLS